MTSLCVEVVHKWPDAWCHSEFKGLTVSKKIPAGPTWVRAQPLLCKHNPSKPTPHSQPRHPPTNPTPSYPLSQSPGAPGRGTIISHWACEFLMQRGGGVRAHTLIKTRTQTNIKIHTHKDAERGLGRWIQARVQEAGVVWLERQAV